MRSLAVLAVAGVLAVVVQTALLRQVPLLPAAPELIVVLTVYLGLHYPTPGGAFGSFLLGYLLDTFSGSPPGLYCLSMTSVFAMVYVVSQRLWVENPITNLAAVALGGLTKMGVVVVYFALAKPGAASWPRLLRTLALEGTLAIAVAPFVFSSLDAYLKPIWSRRSRPRGAD